MERSNKRLVYICSPYSGDRLTNTEKAKRYSRFAVDAGAVPFAPHLLLPLYMKEDSERGQALYMDLVFLGRSDELWVFGNQISSGMQTEIDRAHALKMPVRYFSEDMKEETDERSQHYYRK
jgi:hypothetical protein